MRIGCVFGRFRSSLHLFQRSPRKPIVWRSILVGIAIIGLDFAGPFSELLLIGIAFATSRFEIEYEVFHIQSQLSQGFLNELQNLTTAIGAIGDLLKSRQQRVALATGSAWMARCSSTNSTGVSFTSCSVDWAAALISSLQELREGAIRGRWVRCLTIESSRDAVCGNRDSIMRRNLMNVNNLG